ncbi:MAG: alkaline phosphatase [Chitinophagaceae bacterium]|nr:alkaline phosphatase [Anaerolineae bacterium]
MSKTRTVRRLSSLALLFLMLIVISVPLSAQEEAVPLLIFPVDGAQFLPGTRFDFQIEVHADALPEDFSVTVNGEDAATFLGQTAVESSWMFGDEGDETPAQAVTWQQLVSPAPGEYIVEVTAGGNTQTATWTVRPLEAGAGARNIILFVADGGQIPLFTAARLVSRGQTNGVANDSLSFEMFEEIGLSRTAALYSVITDSAAGASAWMTGHKAAVAATGSYPNTSPDTLDDPRLETFAELIVRTRGMSVGIASNGDVTGATGAALYGHARERDDLERNAFIAAHLDNGPFINVILGGGSRYFIPASQDGSRREDERNLLDEYQSAGYSLVQTATELDAIISGETLPTQLLGLFNDGGLEGWLDVNVYPENAEDYPDQPGLVEMTLAALPVLNQNPNGFFLMVEDDYIDSALHVLDTDRAIANAIEFERAIAAAYEWTQANAPDTLIVVTADHGFGFDVYGTVDVEAFNAAEDNNGRLDAIELEDEALPPTYEDGDGDYYPDTWDVSRTLATTFGSHPDYTEDFQVSPSEREPVVPVDEEENEFIDNPDDDPNGIVQVENIPIDGEDSYHSMTDVPIYATGPGADFFGRVIENREFFFGMMRAIGLDPLTETAP